MKNRIRAGESLAVGGVGRAVGNCPVHAGGWERIASFTHPNQRLATARAFDQPEVKLPLGRWGGTVTCGRATPKLVRGTAAKVGHRAAPTLALVQLAQREVDIFLR